MAVRTSTGYANAILGPTAFDILMQDGVVEIRSGAQPATADMAAAGSLLGIISRDGGAWLEGVATNGLRVARGLAARAAVKEPSHEWRLTGSGTGIAGHFRWRANPPDAGGLSTSAVRIDGAIGLLDDVGDYQLFLPNLNITPSTDIVIDDWWFALPPLGV